MEKVLAILQLIGLAIPIVAIVGVFVWMLIEFIAMTGIWGFVGLFVFTWVMWAYIRIIFFLKDEL